MLLKSVFFELCAYKVNEIATQCHLRALLISTIIGEMFDMNTKYLIQRDKELFEMSYQ